MLLNNYSVFNSNVGREIGNAGGVANIFCYMKASTLRNFYIGDHVIVGQTDKACFPTGTQSPYNLVLAPNGGELSSTTMITQSSSLVTSLTKGINILSDLSGSGTITDAQLSLIVKLASAILGASTLDSSIISELELAAELSGSGDITASLGIIANVVCGMTGSGSLEAGGRGTASLAADITSSSALSPESLAAAVWNSLAAAFNQTGTMGEIMNSIGTGADPWGVDLPASYTGTQAGAILAQIQTLVDELHQLQGAKLGSVMTVDTINGTRSVGSIVLDLGSPSEGITTVARQ